MKQIKRFYILAKRKCHKQSSHRTIANTLSATCIIYRCRICNRWTKSCLCSFELVVCFYFYLCLCVCLSIKNPSFGIFHSCWFICALVALRKNTRNQSNRVHEQPWNQRRQADSSIALAPPILCSATPRHTIPYRTAAINHSLIYIWNVGDFTFLSNADSEWAIAPVILLHHHHKVHTAPCTKRSPWIRLYQRCINAKCKQLKSNQWLSTEIEKRKAIKASSRIILCYKWRQFLSLFSFFMRQFSSVQCSRGKKEANQKYGSATEIK